MPGLYCTGWVKRGPVGIINTNIIDARETVAAMLEDFKTGALKPAERGKPSDDDTDDQLMALLMKTGKRKEDVVTWQGYQKIDAYESKSGEEKGKPREKVITIPELLKIANQA